MTADIELVASWVPIPEADLAAPDVSYVYGQVKPFRVLIEDAAAGSEVALRVGGIDLGSSAVAAGVATFTPSAHLGLDAGTHTITAIYTDASQNPAVVKTAEGTLTVLKDATNTTLDATVASRDGGKAVLSVSGVVTSTVGTIPVGSVTLMVNGSAYPEPFTVNASGEYSGEVTVSVPADADTVALSAAYSGGTNYQRSEVQQTLALPAIQGPGDPQDVPSTPKNKGAGPSALSNTGAAGNSILWLVGLAVVGGGVSLLLIRRGRKSRAAAAETAVAAPTEDG
nr:hypothetical protein [Leucobacter insecticola]